jgi:glycosyltransferase involved in cell wall biosynthesis
MIIGHYEQEIWNPGGIATYIRHLSMAQQAMGHEVYFLSKKSCVTRDAIATPIIVPDEKLLFAQARKLKLDILHLHTTIYTPPPADLAVIRTVHIHSPYCPSESKYLGQWNQPCDRAYSFPGCLWGHLIDRCGSVRPKNLSSNFQKTQRELAILSRLPVITVSKFLKEQMIQAGYPEDQIHALTIFAPEVLNYSAPPQAGIPHFVFLGRITPQKGLDWLLQALQKVKVPVHLDIAGEGYKKSEMQQLAQKLGLNEQVTFHGWLSAEQVCGLLNSARALIFPSVWHEPAGFVALEAMAHARPVIASRVGGIPEMVLDQVNGLLVEPNDVEALANRIEHLALDWNLAKKMGETGRKQTIEHFTLQIHHNRLQQLYDQIVEQKIAA